MSPARNLPPKSLLSVFPMEPDPPKRSLTHDYNPTRQRHTLIELKPTTPTTPTLTIESPHQPPDSESQPNTSMARPITNPVTRTPIECLGMTQTNTTPQTDTIDYPPHSPTHFSYNHPATRHSPNDSSKPNGTPSMIIDPTHPITHKTPIIHPNQIATQVGS